jgi:hypothetical protein
MTGNHHETTARITAALRASLPGLTERVVARIRAEIPFYAEQDVVAADDLRASVSANIGYILDSLSGTATANLSAPNATGRTRAAQGAPLAGCSPRTGSASRSCGWHWSRPAACPTFPTVM